MTFYKTGIENGKTILLLPGTCCNWQVNFGPVLPFLSQEYHVIAVNYDGFDGTGTEFTTMIEQTEKIEDYIIKEQNMFITLKNATKKYGEEESLVYALDHANLEIGKGEICVILGPSGSGKSTLLNMLGGLDHLDEGEIIVGDRNISGYKQNMLTDYRKEDVGFVFQFYNLIPDLTVAENIEVVSDIAENPLNIDEVLEAMGMEKYRYRFPKELSGGQQQRVAIARAIIKNPKLLLCDELTGALDTKSSKQVLEFIEKINKLYKTTTVIITHNEAIAKMADRVIYIKDGKAQENRMNPEKKSASELEL